TQETNPIEETNVQIITENDTSIVESVSKEEIDLNTSESDNIISEKNEIKSDVQVEEGLPVVSEKKENIEQAPIIADAVTKTIAPVQMKKASFGDKLWSKLTPAKVYGANKVGVLSFVATEEVWVKILQGDKIILEEILYKGDRYNVPADTNYTLTTANAGALTVYLNGKKKNTLGTKGALAENVVLNPDNFN
ncbi:MAG: DUF4115 domain-containing protein, partial [Alphaproteobacteria bacterium]|nr:DUF4115 domain-containing protein [Alphaproteobacteria bacterium]